MAKIYECPIEVRGYELDGFGHVNHSVYMNYFEHARWSLLRQEGITLELFKTHNIWPVIAEVQLKYLKPAYMGDLLIVKTSVLEHGRVHIKFKQQIYKNDVVVTEATMLSVTVNERGRPQSGPPELMRLWEQLWSDHPPRYSLEACPR